MSATVDAVRFPAIGTTAEVVVTDAGALATAREVVEAELAELDAACSRFREDSELSRLNACAGEWMPVSRCLAGAVTSALRIAAATGGLVDPTVGSAVRLLGYDRDFRGVDPSGPPVVVRAGRVPGWRAVEVDAAARRIRIPAGTQLDLGATAKAWCADRAAARAAAATRRGVLVGLGGDVAVAGDPPAGGWAVKVADDHAAPLDAPGPVVTVESGGMATSSTTVRRWRRGGEDLHHIVDPATGRSASVVWRTVTVVAATCVDANAASTAAIILGAAAPGWLEAAGLPARLVAATGEPLTVAGWPADDPAEGGR